MRVRARSPRLFLLRLEDRLTPTLNVWTGRAGDGLWSNENNWSEFRTPTAADDAIINSNVTVTHNTGDDTVHSLAISTGAILNLTGGSITDPTTLDAPTGDSHFNLAGGTLSGATVSAGSIVFVSSSGGTLDGVTLAGTLDLTTNVSARVTGGLTLNGGTVLLGSSTGNYGVLSFDGGSQTLGGTGTVVFGTSFSDFLQAGPTSGSALTIGPNVLVRGATGSVGYSVDWGGPTDVSVTLRGTIDADTAGGSITVLNDTNYSSGTLTGGTWESTAGALRLPGQPVTTNAATVVLDGPSAGIFSDAGTTDALVDLQANAAAGSLTVNGRTLTTAGAFVNFGTLTVGPGGTLTLPAGAAVDIQGGLLAGTGTIHADVTNSGTVDPGPGIGALTIAGNYTQTAAGTLAVEIGGLNAGTDFDQLNVAGSVRLDGRLSVNLVTGFVPNVLDQFVILDNSGPGGVGNHFAGLADRDRFSIPGLATFRVTYAGGTGNDLTLTALNIAPTLDAIADPAPVLENAGPQTIDLTGITSGDPHPHNLTVTATSDNPGLIPDPTVTYTSPDTFGSLTYTPVADHNGTATITVTVTDDGGTGDGAANDFTRTFTVTVTPVNDAPTLDSIPDPVPILEDSDPQTIPLTGISAGPNESQRVTVTATSDNPGLIPDPTVTYSSPDATGTLVFRPVPYQFGTATITVTVRDDGGTANGGADTFSRTFTATITHVPHAPQLDTDPLTVLDPVPVRTKTTDQPAGTLVADLIAGRTFDPDGDPVGIAITGLDPANTITKGVPKFGVWQFSTDGTTWNPIPLDVSATKALVLAADAATRVRFLPNLKFQGLSHLTFLAWDHTDAATAGTTADSTTAPGSYGTAAEWAWVAVGKTKPAVTTTGATALVAVREDAKGSRVFAVKTLLGLAGLESRPATNLGIAITGLSTTTGTWQYRLAKTKTFVLIDPTASPTHALLLRPIDSVRFIPAANTNGTGDLTFKTWVPDADFGTYATDTTGTAFGRDSGAASIPITAVNDAPVLDPTKHPDLGTVSAGRTTGPITVGDLLATAPGVATDIDSTGLGVQLMPASSKIGQWQYFDTAANAWKTLTAAKLLAANVQVRFQAAAGVAAGPINLNFKAWDGKLLSKAVGTITLTIG